MTLWHVYSTSGRGVVVHVCQFRKGNVCEWEKSDLALKQYPLACGFCVLWHGVVIQLHPVQHQCILQEQLRRLPTQSTGHCIAWPSRTVSGLHCSGHATCRYQLLVLKAWQCWRTNVMQGAWRISTNVRWWRWCRVVLLHVDTRNEGQEHGACRSGLCHEIGNSKCIPIQYTFRHSRYVLLPTWNLARHTLTRPCSLSCVLFPTNQRHQTNNSALVVNVKYYRIVLGYVLWQ